MLRDHQRFSAEDRRFHDVGLTTMLDIDPPDHTRLRSLVSHAFTPRSVSRWEGRVQEIADRLLDAAAGDDRFDLIAALGYPLPVTVISEMLGVPAEDMDRFSGAGPTTSRSSSSRSSRLRRSRTFGVPPRSCSPTSRPSWRLGSASPGRISSAPC